MKRITRERKPMPDYPVVTRAEYKEILMARMAAGDLYAAEDLKKIRMADMSLDILREKPIYGKIK